MLKLYKIADDSKSYWETWENGGLHTIHWGDLGARGESKKLKSTILRKATAVIQKEADLKIAEGYAPVEDDDHYTLLIEFSVDGMGSGEDVEKRHRLQDRMSETLGWTGLGHCHGGNIGSGTMEVCCFVVDFDVAKHVIEEDLKGTEFEDFTRIYDENAEC